MSADAPPRGDAVDYAALYDAHPEYAARRSAGSYAQASIDLEVAHFKLPNLLALLDGQAPPDRIVEIGCATGELVAAFPVAPGGRRIGLDISARNVAAARERFPGVDFRAGDFRTIDLGPSADLVLLSDVLEHVPDAAAFLCDASRLGHRVLVNLPLEDNWLNRGRAYGPADVSGHLRAYTWAQGQALFAEAGLRIERQRRVWVHETPAEALRRALRRRHFGHAYDGSAPVRAAKRALFAAARACPPFGRRLFASNLFVLASAGDPRR